MERAPLGDWRTTLAWPLALAAGAIAGSLATACMMPLVAVAVLSAATMDRRQATITAIGCWAANQVIGFGLLGFPAEAHALVWGAALGVAALASMLAARTILAQLEVSASVLALVFLATFAGYEALLFGFALVAGGLDTFDPVIVLRLLASEAAWLVALGLFRLALTRVAPAVFGLAVLAGEPVRRTA